MGIFSFLLYFILYTFPSAFTEDFVVYACCFVIFFHHWHPKNSCPKPYYHYMKYTKRCIEFIFYTPSLVPIKYYKSNFRSFSLIQPILLKKRPNPQVSTPGKIKQIRIRPNQSMLVIPVLVPAAISETQPV